MPTIAALYQFTPFDDPAAIKPVLVDVCSKNGVRGSLLLAHEGINGTIAGSQTGIGRVLDEIRRLPGCERLEWKESQARRMPFRKLRVRLKKEIVTMGQPNVDPCAAVGHYVKPANWNQLIRSPDVAVIDTRNRYEIAIGTFDGSISPGTDSFSEFPKWWEANEERFQNGRIAMFCTGGIRCEKATSYLIGRGFRDVYHLKGGILKYLEEISEDRSAWRGECYVFDERVSVKHGLAEGSHSLCHACGRPLSAADRLSPEYEEGVQCRFCTHEYTPSDRKRFRERQRQIDLGRRVAMANGNSSQRTCLPGSFVQGRQ